MLESGKGMGMTRFQILRMVELPLSLSVIMAGLRTALVVTIGVATIGTFIGSGGLGDIIIRGTNASDGTAIILAGALRNSPHGNHCRFRHGLAREKIQYPEGKRKGKEKAHCSQQLQNHETWGWFSCFPNVYHFPGVVE